MASLRTCGHEFKKPNNSWRTNRHKLLKFISTSIQPRRGRTFNVRQELMNSDANALRIVSFLFLLGALSSVAEFFLSFTQSRLFLPWGILGFWIYFRLPAFRRPWRTVALVLLIIPVVLIPIVTLVALFSGVPTYIEIFGIRVAYVPFPIFLLWGASFWLLSFWPFRVLMRPSIREEFMKNT